MGNLFSAEQQLDDAETVSSLPVFDPTTPKVSVLSIGMNTIESAKKLVEQAIQQTVDFEAQAELKATFASMAYEQEHPVQFHSRVRRAALASLRAAGLCTMIHHLNYAANAIQSLIASNRRVPRSPSAP